MGKYKIKVDYITGDSFGGEHTFDYLELEWDNLDIAKENLKAVKLHHEWYSEVESYRRTKTEKELYDKFFHTNHDFNWWMPDFKQGGHFTHYHMKLKADNGNLMQQMNYWCGYFETLLGAEIESDVSDTKFTI